MRRRAAAAGAFLVSFWVSAGVALAQEIPGDQPVSHVNWFSFHYDHQTSGPPLFWILFNFLALVWVFKRFFGPSIAQYLKQRYAEAKKLITDAREMRDRAEARLREYEARLQGLEQEIAKIVADLRAEAEAEKAQLIAAAEEEAVRLRKETDRTIAQELQRLRTELERDVVARALAQAEELVRRSFGDADDKRLADRYLAELRTAVAARAGASS